ncbi:MAG: dienelactone hydrolase family protein [Alphaproteobacteria bacterium]|nr:dienelactone hydrolase family protein [Alphaproteobacteria bacterium]
MTDITLSTKDGGAMGAYVAMPAVTPAPVVIVIQEIFGINAEIRQRCDNYARDGFIAVAPDLFWRLEPGVQLTDRTEAEWQKAFDLYQRFAVDQGIEDLDAVATFFKNHEDSNGKVGCVGFCLGGKLAYLMACRTDIDAAVGYYGVEIDKFLSEAPGIKKPLMLHIAEEDKFVTHEQQEVVKAGLADHPQVTIYSYPGKGHAFSRIGGEAYCPETAATARSRSLAFLRDAL